MSQGQIRHHYFGEGEYEESERVIQELLAEAGGQGVDTASVRPQPRGVELGADWDELEVARELRRLPTHRGFRLSRRPGARRAARLRSTVNHTAQRVGSVRCVVNEHGFCRPDGTGRRHIVPFPCSGPQPRDGPGDVGQAPVRFRARIDGQPPGPLHGIDVDDDGNGTVKWQRLYQLVRQPGPIGDRNFDIEFLDAGAEAFVFTFG